MRDVEIIESQQRMADAVNYNMAQTAHTLSRVGARLTAIERILFGHRLSLIRMAILCILSPKSVIDALNKAERDILNQLQSDIDAKRAVAKEAKRAPSLILPKGGLAKV